MGFGPRCLQMLFSSYHNPTGCVLLNSQASLPFTLSRGTRQGCPLSPLLFALFVEPLACGIPQAADIKGVPFAAQEYKLVLYTDDILLAMGDPSTSLTRICALLHTFERVTGFKVNYDKSEILNLTLSDVEVQEIRPRFPFKWAKQHITYLG